MLKLLDQRKGAKRRWLQVPSEINADSVSNIQRETSRHFRNKKREYLRGEIYDLATNSKNTNIRDLYRRLTHFKWGYQPRSNSVKDENGDLLAVPDPSSFEVEIASMKLKSSKSP
jgi:hypothetical protein